MIQALEYDKREAISTVRELLDYNYNTSEELIVLEVRQRGIVVDPIWLVEIIENEQERGGDTRPIVLAAYGLTRNVLCSDCSDRADYAILIDISPDWKYVCESCNIDYKWNDDTEVATD